MQTYAIYTYPCTCAYEDGFFSVCIRDFEYN